MAARQGFSAHISQASEDAKRAVLSRAPTAIKSHYWLNNLNTTCTIKSAPPRTPEVMEMLSTHSGWLVKRNEQHVWQRRWCCVVPHMFLYYFEAEPEREDACDEYDTNVGFSGGGIYRSDELIVENQDVLNDAVKNGYNRINGVVRSSSPIGKRDLHHERKSTSSPQHLDRKYAAPVRGPTTRSHDLSPSGIIDLECYSSVNLSSVHDLVFELTGDPITNPDLRSFYFQAGSGDDLEIWTRALLADRHSALQDEREAYRQVCDSFQLQLQNMSDMIDAAEGKTADVERQLYNVRSQSQKFRTQIVAIVREAFEQNSWLSAEEMDKNTTEKLIESLEQTRLTCLDQLDEIVSSSDTARLSKDYGALAVQLLADYLATVVGSYTEQNSQLYCAQQKLTKSEGIDHEVLSDMKLKLEKVEEEKREERAMYESKIAEIDAQLKDALSRNDELRNQMNTQRLDFSMFQTQAKSKLQELSSHKKILKKEVIDLRKKVEEIESERDAALHITSSVKSSVETEKEKNQVLEKYIESMENQVRVQQNMMEMISLSGMSDMRSRGGGSVVGRIIGANDDQSFSSFGQFISEQPYNNNRDPAGFVGLPPSMKGNKPRFPSSSIPLKNEEVITSTRGVLDAQLQSRDGNDYHKKLSLPPKIANRFPSETHDDDNQSTFSELTEDRTQRAFDAVPRIHYTTSDMTGQNIMSNEQDGDGEVSYEKISRLEDKEFPPKYIIGAPDDAASQKTSKTEKMDDNQSKVSRVGSVVSTHSESSSGSKLSVAQRSRIAADQSICNSIDLSNSLPISSLNEKFKINQAPKTRSRSPGVLQQLGRRVVTVIDNSPLGVKLPDDNVPKPMENRLEDKFKEMGEEVKLTLEERQRIQRERQIQMLKAKGIIKDDSDIKGGAGSSSPRRGKK